MLKLIFIFIFTVIAASTHKEKKLFITLSDTGFEASAYESNEDIAVLTYEDLKDIRMYIDVNLK